MKSEENLKEARELIHGVNGKTEIKAEGSRDQRPQGRTVLFGRDLRLGASERGQRESTTEEATMMVFAVV